jgi:hypothetical protein
VHGSKLTAHPPLAPQEKAVVSMQDGWAVELKRHKEAWAAAEKIKREQWCEMRTAEIKEITIKGLEHEVHNILAKQKAEILRLQVRCCAAVLLRRCAAAPLCCCAAVRVAGHGGSGSPVPHVRVCVLLRLEAVKRQAALVVRYHLLVSAVSNLHHVPAAA